MIYIIQPTSLFLFLFFTYILAMILVEFRRYRLVSVNFGWFRPESTSNRLVSARIRAKSTGIDANLPESTYVDMNPKKRLIDTLEERHRVAASSVRVQHPFCRVSASEHITIPNAHARLWKIRVIGETFCIICVSIDSMVGRRN